MVLANLCVAYIMTSANEEAEEIMRLVEAAEEEAIAVDPDTQVSRARSQIPTNPCVPKVHRMRACLPSWFVMQVFHLCIINLVIGTLYCSKGNYEFGVSRVIKSLVRRQTSTLSTRRACARCLACSRHHDVDGTCARVCRTHWHGSWARTRGTTPSDACWRWRRVSPST